VAEKNINWQDKHECHTTLEISLLTALDVPEKNSNWQDKHECHTTLSSVV
jgi:hypothetical protein